MKYGIITSVIIFLMNTSPSGAMELSGTVKDSASGEPLANVYVVLRLSLKTLGRDTTDSKGAFKIQVNSSGEYTLRVVDLGGIYPQKSIGVTIECDIDQVVDIKVVRPPTITISGSVTDSAAGTPIAGAFVMLQRGVSVAITDTTDSEGGYSVTAPVATYRVYIYARGYAPKNLSLELSESTAQPMDFQLTTSELTAISGTITDSAEGTPLSESKVVLYYLVNIIDSAITNEAGTYAIDSVPYASYTLVVSCDKYNQKRRVITINDTSATTFDIALTKTIYSVVSGTVTDVAEGTALAEAKVVLYRGLLTPFDSCLTNAEGTYRFDNVPNGIHMIVVTLDSYNMKADTVTITDTVPNTTDFALVKTVYSPITGTVTDSAEGTALAEAKVVLYMLRLQLR